MDLQGNKLIIKKGETMKLKELRLTNYKGLKNFHFIPDRKDASILGGNATGKTTVADGVAWLIDNKDSLGNAAFEIKTITPSGEHLHNLEHTAEATFVSGIGQEVKLKKAYKEKYTKKRGSNEIDFTGHTTDYYIDDVPVKEKDYIAKVAELCGGQESRFRLLSSPTYFASMKWQDQRSILIDCFGDITDADVITTSKDLDELPAILNGKTCEDYRLIVNSKRKKINDELKGIPDRIDEAERSRPEILTVTNAQHCIDKLTKLRSEEQQKRQEISDIKSGGGIVKLQQRLSQQEIALTHLTAKHQQNINSASDELDNARQDAVRKYDSLGIQKKEAVDQMARIQMDLESFVEANDELARQYDSLADEKFHGDTCPTCSQKLPASQLDSAVARFNSTKSTKLEEIQRKGLANKERIEGYHRNIADLKKLVGVLTDEAIQLERDIAGIDKNIAAAKESAPKLEELPEYQEIVREKTAIEQEIESIRTGNTAKTEQQEAELSAILEKIQDNEKLIAAIEATQKQDTRIAELKNQEKDLSKEYQVLEKHLFLIDTFTRAKVSMLDDKINSNFEIVRFNLSKEQINGGIQDCCEMTISGVPYGSLNNAAKIQGGLDVIKTLSAKYNFHPIIMIDNRESVTEIPEMDAQVISLYVSPKHETLTVVQ